MSKATIKDAITNAVRKMAVAATSTAAVIGLETAAPKTPPSPGKARSMRLSPDKRNTNMLNSCISPKCRSKDLKIRIANRRSERGSKRYPMPRSHERYLYITEPTNPPTLKRARIKNTAMATKKIARTPRTASALTWRGGSNPSFWFFSVRFLRATSA